MTNILTAEELQIMVAPSSFKDRALPLIKRGIYVTPLEPKNKRPFLPDWQNTASSNPAQIEKWQAEYPDANVGCVATCGKCFLDDDRGDLRERIEAETGETFPETYTVLTSVKKSGLRGRHHYFNRTAKALMTGNRALADTFDFQCVRKQVVGAYSIHPSGIIYTPEDPRAAIVDIPEWLLAWIEKNTPDDSLGASTSHEQAVSEDFDFDAFCDHYEKQGAFTLSNHGNGWMTTDVCPVAGYRHEQSKDTGFFYDGTFLRWHCFATGCAGHNMSIGGVLKFFNEKYTPYPGVIWDKEEEEPYDDWAELETPEASSGEETEVSYVSHAQSAVNAEEAAVAASMDATPVEAPNPLTFPVDALYGRLGEKAQGLEMPLGLAYPAVLGVFSILPDKDCMAYDTRVNLYVSLIAPVGGGKDTAIKRAMQTLETPNDVVGVTDVVSDWGLMGEVGDHAGERRNSPRTPGPQKRLLVTFEMSNVLKKGNILNSTLCSTLCHFWDHNRKAQRDKATMVTADCRLSWIGGVPIPDESPEQFAEIFGNETSQGLLSRMLLGYDPQRFVYKAWKHKTEREKASADVLDDADLFFRSMVAPCVTKVDREAEALFNAWANPGDLDGRLKYNLMRVAVLTASANKEDSVTKECMAAACSFMDWQAKLRGVFKPGVAENNIEAKFTEVFLNTLRRRGATSDSTAQSWKLLVNRMRWNEKFGSTVINRTVDNLIKTGTLVAVEKEVEDDRGNTKVKKTSKVWVRDLR